MIKTKILTLFCLTFTIPTLTTRGPESGPPDCFTRDTTPAYDERLAAGPWMNGSPISEHIPAAKTMPIPLRLINSSSTENNFLNYQ